MSLSFGCFSLRRRSKVFKISVSQKKSISKDLKTAVFFYIWYILSHTKSTQVQERDPLEELEAALGKDLPGNTTPAWMLGHNEPNSGGLMPPLTYVCVSWNNHPILRCKNHFPNMLLCLLLKPAGVNQRSLSDHTTPAGELSLRFRSDPWPEHTRLSLALPEHVPLLSRAREEPRCPMCVTTIRIWRWPNSSQPPSAVQCHFSRSPQSSPLLAVPRATAAASRMVSGSLLEKQSKQGIKKRPHSECLSHWDVIRAWGQPVKSFGSHACMTFRRGGWPHGRLSERSRLAIESGTGGFHLSSLTFSNKKGGWAHGCACGKYARSAANIGKARGVVNHTPALVTRGCHGKRRTLCFTGQCFIWVFVRVQLLLDCAGRQLRICAPFLVSVRKHKFGFSNSRYGHQARVAASVTAISNTEK